jgi:hypothetical protein
VLDFNLAQNNVGVQVNAVEKSHPHRPYVDGGSNKERVGYVEPTTILPNFRITTFEGIAAIVRRSVWGMERESPIGAKIAGGGRGV